MKYLLAIIVVHCLWTIDALAADSVFITRVHDGDTPYAIVAKQEHAYRLRWADCPEMRFAGKWDTQPFAYEALAFTQDKILRLDVTITPAGGGESYNRDVVSITYRDEAGKEHDLATELVKRGLAACDPRFDPPAKLLHEQAKAQAATRGMWGLPKSQLVMPWDWRKGGE